MVDPTSPTVSSTAEFEKAIEDSSKLAGGVTNDDLLRMYGLFKQGKQDPSFEDTTAPGMFDLKGKAKYNAWKQHADAKLEPADAQKQYIALIGELTTKYGTKDGSVSVQQPKLSSNTSVNRGGAQKVITSIGGPSSPARGKSAGNAAIDKPVSLSRSKPAKLNSSVTAAKSPLSTATPSSSVLQPTAVNVAKTAPPKLNKSAKSPTDGSASANPSPTVAKRVPPKKLETRSKNAS